MEKITLSVSETAELLGVSVSTIYVMARLNEIPHKKVRGRVLFHRQTVENWLISESEVNTDENQHPSMAFNGSK